MHAMPNEKISWGWSLARIPLLILVVSVLLPYYWMAIGAFKTVPELVQQPPTFVVEKPTVQNFYDSGYEEENPKPDHWAGVTQRKSDGHGFMHYYGLQHRWLRSC
jgi:ABC-type glycerol-3-phosphate transport system permease component